MTRTSQSQSSSDTVVSGVVCSTWDTPSQRTNSCMAPALDVQSWGVSCPPSCCRTCRIPLCRDGSSRASEAPQALAALHMLDKRMQSHTNVSTITFLRRASRHAI